jgi:hypothetical protein
MSAYIHTYIYMYTYIIHIDITHISYIIIIIIIIIIKCGCKIPTRLLFFDSCSTATITHGLLDEFSLRFTSVCPGKRWESISNGARKDSFHVSPTRYSITVPSFDVIKYTLRVFKASLNTTRINKTSSEYIYIYIYIYI